MKIATKKLFVFLDGTWQDGVNNNSPLTNVATLARCLQSQASDGSLQIVYYSSGVGNGTSKPSQVIDAVTGRGLSAKVREAYSFISHNYNFIDNSDEIYLIGFSRGAFAAQCLASFISQTGLMPKEYLYYLRGLFTLWANQKIESVFKEFEKRMGELERSGALRRVEIKALALWDTVSSLAARLPPRPLAFVGEQVPECVRYAFQAVALNEERTKFVPVVWRSKEENTKVSQCWFLGGHSDVGGSEDAALGLVTLLWMIGKLHRLDVSFSNQEISKHMKSKYLEWNCSANRLFKSVNATSILHHLPREVKATEPSWYWWFLGRRPRGNSYLQSTMTDIPGSQRVFNEIHFTVRLTKQQNPSRYKCRALQGWEIDPETMRTRRVKQWRLVEGAQNETLDEHDLTPNDEEFRQLKSWCTPPPAERQCKTDRTPFAEKVQVPGSEKELEKFREFLKRYIDGLEIV